MPRPDTTLDTLDPQQGNWHETIEANQDKLLDLTVIKPSPKPLVHRATPDSGSVLLSTYAASDYKWCDAIVVDPATPSTNGYDIFSDGSNWRYKKSNSVVS